MLQKEPPGELPRVRGLCQLVARHPPQWPGLLPSPLQALLQSREQGCCTRGEHPDRCSVRVLVHAGCGARPKGSLLQGYILEIFLQDFHRGLVTGEPTRLCF